MPHKIDEVTGTADGLAIDFIRMPANRKRENACKGNIKGIVADKETEHPVTGAKGFLVDKTSVITDAEERFGIKDIPTGSGAGCAASSGGENY